jgi:hypothetical protein
MAAWLRLHLNQGAFPGGRLVGPTAVRELQQAQIHIADLGDEQLGGDRAFGPTQGFLGSIGYGLGWFVTDYRGRPAIFHGGGINGQRSAVGLLPKGRRVRLETLMNGLLMVSGNDAAIAFGGLGIDKMVPIGFAVGSGGQAKHHGESPEFFLDFRPPPLDATNASRNEYRSSSSRMRRSRGLFLLFLLRLSPVQEGPSAPR